MKALLLDPVEQSIEEVQIGGLDDIKALVGFDTIESDAIDSGGDRLFFDEECFLRGTSGRFQIDSVIPVAGKGVVARLEDDGVTFSDVQTDIDDLRKRTKYL